jgi:methionyl-tRNA formyltransferase
MRTVVGFLSRKHGLDALNALTNSSLYTVKAVYTHSLNPRSQDPTRSKRADYDLYVKICTENNIPLIAIDSKDQKIDVPECDFIVEISWRYLIPQDMVKKAKLAAFGIHRGKLPEYAGAEPIKQALLKNETEIVLSAHHLDPVIDRGKTIAAISHPVNYVNSASFDDNVQRLRDEITPLFSKLMFKTFDIFEAEKKA